MDLEKQIDQANDINELKGLLKKMVKKENKAKGGWCQPIGRQFTNEELARFSRRRLELEMQKNKTVDQMEMEIAETLKQNP